jgi:hypothetical protein
MNRAALGHAKSVETRRASRFQRRGIICITCPRPCLAVATSCVVLAVMSAVSPAKATVIADIPAGSSKPADAGFVAKATIPCTHHVATGGSDSHSGTSLPDAWKTVTHAAATLAPGQTACVHAGDYHEKQIEAGHSGTASAPILIRGAPNEAQPRIVSASDTTQFYFRPNIGYWIVERLQIDKSERDGPAVQILGGHHIVIRDTIIRRGKHHGVLVRGHTQNPTTDVLVQRNDVSRLQRFKDAAGKIWYNPAAGRTRQDANGVSIESVNGATVARISVRGNQLHDNSGDGVQCLGVKDAPENQGGGPTASDAADVDIVDNRVYQNTENAVDIKSCQRVSIRGSVSPEAGGSSAANKFFGYRPAGTGTGNTSPGGSAVVLHYYARRVLIENTRIWDSCEGIAVGRADTRVENVVIRRTLMFRFAGPADGPTCKGIGVRVTRAHGMDINHLTIAQAPGAGIALSADTSPGAPATSNIDVWNTIVVTSGDGYWFNVYTPKLTDFESNANIFWRPGGSPAHFRRNFSTPIDLSTWRSQIGQDAISKHQDPVFLPDPELNDYYTVTGSPARDSALDNVGATFCGAGPDIGFLESCQ